MRWFSPHSGRVVAGLRSRIAASPPVAEGLLTVGRVLALAGLLLSGGSLAAADRSPELANRIPRDANAIYVLRVQEILHTDRAVREQWAEKQQERFLNGEAPVPPWVETLVIGSLVRLSVPEVVWSAALATAPDASRIEAAMAAPAGDVEWIGGAKAVHSSRGGLFLDLDRGLIGVFAPPFRQEAGRWVRQMREAGTSGVSPYLLQAAAQPGHIVLAMDLQDMLDPQRVRQQLLIDEKLADNPTARIRLATQLLSLQGATLAITVGDTISSRLRFDFREPLDASATSLQKVFVDAISEMGAMIEEFETAAAAVNGQTLTLECELSEASLQRILSLVVTPPPTPHSDGPAEPPAIASNPPAAAPPAASPPASSSADVDRREASRRYLQAVNRYIDNLRTANRRATNYDRTAMWHDNFARRIDGLATKAVDPELLQYGSTVASSMRALAASLRGQSVQVQVQQGTVAFNYSFDPGFTALSIWGGVGYRAPTVSLQTNLAEVRERQAAAIVAGNFEREQIWKVINDQRARIEQQMRVRYGDDFLR